MLEISMRANFYELMGAKPKSTINLQECKYESKHEIQQQKIIPKQYFKKKSLA